MITGCKKRFAPRSIVGSMSSRDSQIDDHPKSKEGHPMPFRKSPSMDRAGVEQLAEGWGKVVARRVHDEVGPELDLDADDIEQMAVTAARAVARGTIADLLERKAALLGPEQPCPTCQRLCDVRRQPRAIDFWGCAGAHPEPDSHPTRRSSDLPTTAS